MKSRLQAKCRKAQGARLKGNISRNRGLLLESTVFVLFFILFFFFLSGTICAKEVGITEWAGDPKLTAFLKNKIPRDVFSDDIFVDLLSLFSTYPHSCTDIKIGKDRRLYVKMSNGFHYLYDDGKAKTFEDKLNTPDLQDMLEQSYAPGSVNRRIERDYDPGRFRVTDFFKALYGGLKGDVRRNCVSLPLGSGSVLFNSKNGAAKALRSVMDELTALLKKKPDLKRYVYPIGGTFNWRAIAGTNRMSPHSFGIAIDLNPALGAYWLWGKSNAKILKLRQDYPFEIVSFFEDNGFIWGGKWFHYDLMHFEYRPELFFKTKLLEKRR